jgi:hypothetical protein
MPPRCRKRYFCYLQFLEDVRQPRPRPIEELASPLVAIGVRVFASSVHFVLLPLPLIHAAIWPRVLAVSLQIWTDNSLEVRHCTSRKFSCLSVFFVNSREWLQYLSDGLYR